MTQEFKDKIKAIARAKWEEMGQPADADMEIWLESECEVIAQMIQKSINKENRPYIALLARIMWELRNKPSGKDLEIWLEAEERLETQLRDGD